jgi:hypothetical protein
VSIFKPRNLILLILIITELGDVICIRMFYTWYKEHIQAITYNNCNTGYSDYIINTGHAYGSITDTMRVIKIDKKIKHLNVPEKYYIYIYKTSKNGSHK